MFFFNFKFYIFGFRRWYMRSSECQSSVLSLQVHGILTVHFLSLAVEVHPLRPAGCSVAEACGTHLYSHQFRVPWVVHGYRKDADAKWSIYGCPCASPLVWVKSVLLTSSRYGPVGELHFVTTPLTQTATHLKLSICF